MSDGPMLSAARQGDRISHNAKFDDDSAPALAVALGAIVSSGGQGAACAAVGAGASTGSGSGADGMKIAIRDVLPRSASGKLEEGSPDTLLANLPAAVADAQKVDCHHHRDKPIRHGSVSVFVNKKRMSRASDETRCGALICDGDPTIRVGGAQSDDGPPDPLAGLERGAVMAGAAIGRAVTVLDRAVMGAVGYAQALVTGVERDVEQAAASGERFEADVSAKIGGLIGSTRGAVAGALLGGKA